MSDNPFLRRVAAGGHGRKSEVRVAKLLAASLTPASGALRGAKGDMRKGARKKLLVEAKSTILGSMALEFGWLRTVAVRARDAGREPALTISFVSVDGKGKPDGDWVCVPKSLFLELVEDE